MQKVTLFFIASVLLVFFGSFISPKKEKVLWLTVEELQVAFKKQPRPVLVDVYTDWCGWCKVMDRETYSNNQVATYINEKYYAVKFNAEMKDSIEWQGKKYGYNESYRANDLAVYFLQGQMSFPSTVFLTGLTARPATLAGYLKPKEIESPLKFFGEGVYKSKTFPEFMKSFTAHW